MKTYSFLLQIVLTFLLIGCFVFWASSTWADQNDPELDRLFSALLGVDDLAQGSRITEEIWQRWRQVDDTVIGDLFASGIIAMNAHDLGLALDSFDQVIQKAPEFAEGWNKRATVYYLMGEYNHSVRDIRQTLLLEPRHFGAPLVPTKVTLAVAKELGFSWGSDAAFDMLDCNTLASGDVDVINTTLQLILACLDDVKVLASVTEDRIALTPDAPTVGEIVPSLKISLWNGLFVTKGTSQEVKDKLEAVAKRVMLGEKAQALTQETGGAFYWRDAAASAAQIKDNVATMAKINAMLAD